MYLYINTTERESFEIAVFNAKGLIRKNTIPSKIKHSEKLLPSITKLLFCQGFDMHNIKGVIVVKGPGSFTSLRIGVSVANALGYTLGVPVAGVEKPDREISSAEFSSFCFLLKKKNTNPVSPRYEHLPS